MATSRNSNSSIVTTFTNTPLIEVIQDFDSKHIIIPPHQREFCWDINRRQKFIHSILKRYPSPSILMSKSPLDIYPTLEDGRQRITAASRYRNGEFSISLPERGEVYYSQLSYDEQRIFDNYIVMIVKYRNATDDDRIQIFDWHQNGAPLTPGERYHAQHATPLIRFVKEQLMTPGSGYHDRAVAIWGVRGDQVDPPENFISKDKRRKWLLSATALVLGLSFGPANATKKYEPEKGFMTADFPIEKQNAVKKDLERILEIYEEVNRRLASKKPNKWLNPHWDIGTYTGYILYSLSVRMREYFGEDDFENGFYEPNSLEAEPEEWEHIKNTWVEYMVGVRAIINDNPTKKIKNVLEEKIHAGVSKARSWTNARWEDGYKRVFGITIENTNQSDTSEEYEDEDDSEDE